VLARHRGAGGAPAQGLATSVVPGPSAPALGSVSPSQGASASDGSGSGDPIRIQAR
jgi:hypothetical protein